MGLARLSAWEEARMEFTSWDWERMGAEQLWDMLWSNSREQRQEVLPSVPCPALETPADSPEQEDKLGVLDWSHHGDCRLWGSWASGGAHISTLKGQFSLSGLSEPEQLGGYRHNAWKRLG